MGGRAQDWGKKKKHDSVSVFFGGLFWGFFNHYFGVTSLQEHGWPMTHGPQGSVDKKYMSTAWGCTIIDNQQDGKKTAGQTIWGLRKNKRRDSLRKKNEKHVGDASFMARRKKVAGKEHDNNVNSILLQKKQVMIWFDHCGGKQKKDYR